VVAERPSSVPTMWVQGLWDQEDMWGAIHCYLALKDKGQAARGLRTSSHQQPNYQDEKKEPSDASAHVGPAVVESSSASEEN
jgi:predicted acyl esterase